MRRLVKWAAWYAVTVALARRLVARQQDVTRDDHRALGPFPLMGRPRIRPARRP